jgi:peptidyl-dipeptidase A
MKTLCIVALLTAALVVLGCAAQPEPARFENFTDRHVKKLRPLEKQANLVSWEAETTGKPEAYSRLSKLAYKLNMLYANAEDFAYLSKLRQSGQVKEPSQVRQLDLLYRAYLENQIPPQLLKRIVDAGTKVTEKFNTFRGTIDGKKVTNNEILELLKTETDSSKRKLAWLASKQVGPVVAADVIELAKMRNEAARKLGFDNYHTLSLTVGEQDVKELDRIFEKLYELTNQPFTELKADLDARLAAKYGVAAEQLMPWDYHDPFFQETPMVYELNLDSFYRDKDVKALATRFYAGIELPVESILANSDLYERQGKCPHAFCTDIDREGDVRILCNLKNDEGWMETILHELGHAVYDRYHDRQLPYLLRQPAHSFTTEAIAMFFGRLSRNPVWMQQMLGLSSEQRAEIDETTARYMRLKQLIFARWAMVMYNFEKQLYANPDQDLNRLWWDLVEKYQLVKRPPQRNEPDWAAKIHFVIAPCYYHNYMLGEMLASQLHSYIVRNLLQLPSDKNANYVNQTRIGRFLRREVLEPGALYQWNDMIARATGEPLTAKYFVAEFVK